MSEQFKHNDSLPPQRGEQDVISLIKRIQEQLLFLEKKIDLLINQSKAKTFSEKPFSKPFRSFGSSAHRSGREYDHGSREKHFDHGSHSEKRYGEKPKAFGYKKKTYDSPRESESTPGYRSEKRHKSEKKGFDKNKKPGFFKRKEAGK